MGQSLASSKGKGLSSHLLSLSLGVALMNATLLHRDKNISTREENCVGFTCPSSLKLIVNNNCSISIGQNLVQRDHIKRIHAHRPHEYTIYNQTINRDLWQRKMEAQSGKHGRSVVLDNNKKESREDFCPRGRHSV